MDDVPEMALKDPTRLCESLITLVETLEANDSLSSEEAHELKQEIYGSFTQIEDDS